MPEPDPSLSQVVQGAADLLRTAPGPLRRITLRAGDASVELEWPPAGDGSPAAAPSPDADPVPSATMTIEAPMVGTFYHAPEPGAAPFVRPGDLVEPGQQIGILEAMKLMNRVDAETHGRVVEMLVPDATPVEYAQPLVALEPVSA